MAHQPRPPDRVAVRDSDTQSRDAALRGYLLLVRAAARVQYYSADCAAVVVRHLTYSYICVSRMTNAV